MMNRFEKAWKDLADDPNIEKAFTGSEDNPDSHWVIVPGVKIERFKDGTIVLKSIYVDNDRYKDFNYTHQMYFEDYGFWAGFAKVNLDYFSDELIRYGNILSRCTDDESKAINQAHIDDCEKKVSMYEKKLANALKIVE